MSAQRPMVNVYEPLDAPADEQELVYREMNDEELAVWEADRAAAELELETEQRPAILAEVEALTEDERAELRELLG